MLSPRGNTLPFVSDRLPLDELGNQEYKHGWSVIYITMNVTTNYFVNIIRQMYTWIECLIYLLFSGLVCQITSQIQIYVSKVIM